MNFYPGAQRQGTKLVDPKAGGAGLCASPACAWRGGGVGAAGAELNLKFGLLLLQKLLALVIPGPETLLLHELV